MELIAFIAFVVAAVIFGIQRSWGLLSTAIGLAALAAAPALHTLQGL